MWSPPSLMAVGNQAVRRVPVDGPKPSHTRHLVIIDVLVSMASVPHMGVGAAVMRWRPGSLYMGLRRATARPELVAVTAAVTTPRPALPLATVLGETMKVLGPATLAVTMIWETWCTR